MTNKPDFGQLGGEGAGERFDIHFHEQMRDWDEELRRILRERADIIQKLTKFVAERTSNASSQQQGTKELLREAEIYLEWPSELRAMIEQLQIALENNDISSEDLRQIKDAAKKEIPSRLEEMERYLQRTSQAFDAAEKGAKNE